jgi:multidrug efflux system membrane fusion protein
MNLRSTLCVTLPLAGILGLLTSCGPKSGPPPQRPPATVTVSQPVEREVVEWDEYPARLEAVEMVEVRSRVNGYLQSINFKDGAEVKKGDLLFVIDPRPYQAELEHATADLKQMETRLELANSELARAEKLVESRAISVEESDSRRKAKREAEAAIQSSKAMVDMAKLNVDYTHIISPITGRIGRRLITEGNLVSGGSQGQSTLLTTIVSLDPIYCYFDVDESAALRYQKVAREGKADGKVPCELGLVNETGFPHKGTLDFLNNQVDSTSGTLHIRAIFPNPAPDRTLQPGFFARARVSGSTPYRALQVPDLAVGTDQGQKFVYVVNDTKIAEYRKVVPGPVVDGQRVIREGIKSTDWVIVNGLMGVRPGAPVNPTKPDGKGEPPPAAQAKK